MILKSKIEWRQLHSSRDVKREYVLQVELDMQTGNKGKMKKIFATRMNTSSFSPGLFVAKTAS